MNKKESGHIVIFKSDDGKVSVDARFDAETAWLSLDQMAALFERDKSTVSRHVKNIFEEGELRPEAVVAKIATTAADDWIAALDTILNGNGRVLLVGTGTVSHRQAVEKAEQEFNRYRAKEMRELESDFDRMLKEIEEIKKPEG